MQIPQRRAQKLRKNDEDDVLRMTRVGVERMERELKNLEAQKPAAIEEVTRTHAMGDLSENAEYQEAKFKLRRIDARIFSLNDRLKRVVLIEGGTNEDGRIRLGSTVTVIVNGKTKTFDIVGPQETNPARGRISDRSPLGLALLNHKEGERVIIETGNGPVTYDILEVR